MKKVNWIVVIAGAVVGIAAVVLTLLGNPANMGFCIACFLRDIAGGVGMHSSTSGRKSSALCSAHSSWRLQRASSAQRRDLLRRRALCSAHS